MRCGECFDPAFFTVTESLSRVFDMLSKSFAENRSASVKWSSKRLIVDVREYAAGASLVRPIVMKNSDSSWKQLSRTLSTVRTLALQYEAIWVGRGLTSIFSHLLLASGLIELSHLLDSLII